MSDSADASNGGYDIVILGGGSGGYACALRAAELGKRVALIEEDKVGGTCLHRGLHPDQGAAARGRGRRLRAAKGRASACAATFDGIDMAGVNAYKDKVVTRLWKGLTGLVASRKIEVIEGHGKLISPTVGPGRRPGHHRRARRARDRLADAAACRAWCRTATASSPATTRCGLITCPPRSSSSAAA